MQKHSEQVVRTADVIAKKVTNPQGEVLGKIEEIVLDKISGQCRYVVLSFGGILGMGNKFFAIPWKLISYEPETEGFILSVAKEKLANAPGFEKDHWPDMATQDWNSSIDNFYG